MSRKYENPKIEKIAFESEDITIMSLLMTDEGMQDLVDEGNLSGAAKANFDDLFNF